MKNFERSKSFNSEEFYSSLSFSMRIYQFFGCAPFAFSKKGIEKSVIRFYVTILQNFICLIFCSLIGAWRHLEGDESDLKIHASFDMIIIIICIIAVWFESITTVRKWWKLLQKIEEVDKKIAKYRTKLCYANDRKQSLLILAGVLKVNCWFD